MPRIGATRSTTPPIRRQGVRAVAGVGVDAAGIAHDIPVGSGAMSSGLRAVLAWRGMTRLLHRLGSWCAAHPLTVVAAWLTVALTATLLAATVGGRYSQG